jgi:hypothetical protein
MQKTKKWTSILVCAACAAFMAAGCSSSDSNDSTSTDSSDKTSDTAASTSDKTTIEETVLLDQDNIKITATEYDTDAIFGDYINLEIENNTDQNLMFSADAVIVNDYNISDLFATEVAAGKKSNEKLYLSTSDLEAAGIDQVGEVEIYFNIYDDDTLDTYLKSDDIVIKTSAYDSMNTTTNITGKELYNENGIKIVAEATDEDSFWGTSILLYIENNSGQNIVVQIENFSINGYMMDPLFSATVYNGKKCVSDITILSSDLEDNDIDKIEDVELQFDILNADTFDTIVTTDPITFKVNE